MNLTVCKKLDSILAVLKTKYKCAINVCISQNGSDICYAVYSYPYMHIVYNSIKIDIEKRPRCLPLKSIKVLTILDYNDNKIADIYLKDCTAQQAAERINNYLISYLRN